MKETLFELKRRRVSAGAEHSPAVQNSPLRSNRVGLGRCAAYLALSVSLAAGGIVGCSSDGPAGPEGPAGHEGPAGATGATGAQGPAGEAAPMVAVGAEPNPPSALPTPDPAAMPAAPAAMPATPAAMPATPAAMPPAAAQTADFTCPAGVVTPDLTGVTATAVAGVPLQDGYGGGEFAILEGPVWTGDALYLSHIVTNMSMGGSPASRILKLVPGTPVEIIVEEAGVNGLALGGPGQLLVGRHFDGTVSNFNLADNTFAPVAQTYTDLRFNSPNDVTARGDGNIYFTDPDWQAPQPVPQLATRAYRVDPAGVVSVIDDTLQNPNGISLSLDESFLFISGQSPLMRYPVMADGSVGAGAPFGNVEGADGMSFDCAGNLYVTGGDRVAILDPNGTEIGSIAAAGATNVAFGGANRTTLYITSLNASMPQLFQAEIGIQGMPF